MSRIGSLTLFLSLLVIKGYAAPVFENGGQKIPVQELIVSIGNSIPAVADWDNDGLNDLIIGDQEGFVWFYKNNGSRSNPNFTSGSKLKDSNGQDIQVNCHYATPHVVDWNNDHILDLIVGNSNGTVYLYLGEGNGQLQSGSSTIPLSSNALRAIHFVNPQTGWAVGDNGFILYTSDSGNSWIPQDSKSQDNLNGLFLIDQNQGYAVGNKAECVYLRNGAWQRTAGTMPTTSHLNSVTFLGQDNGWAVGDNGTILQFKNGLWQTSASVTTKADLSAVKFADARNGWAVGGNGTVIRIDANPAGTPTGSIITAVTSFDLNDLALFDANNGWAVGDNGTFLELRNGNWSVVSPASPPVTNDLQSVFLLGTDTGIAVGKNGIIFRLSVPAAGGNPTWNQIISPTTNHLNSVFFADLSNGWIAGDNGSVLHTSDAGQTWELQPLSIDVGRFSAPYVFDLDEDNNKDLVIGDEHGYVWFFKNQGNDANPLFSSGFRISLGTLALSATYTNYLDVGQYARPVVIDWDGDGIKDLIIGNETGNVYLYKGRVEKTTYTDGLIKRPLDSEILWFLPQPQAITVANRPIDVGRRSSPYVVDWNKDGSLDLLVGSEDGDISLFINTKTSPGESPEFNAASKVKGPQRDMQIGPYSLPIVVDWNNDGKKDMLIGDRYGFVTLFLNEGSNRQPIFSAGFRFQTGTPTASIDLDAGNFAAPFPVDWNNDGKKDLLVGDEYGQLQLFLNLSSDQTPIFGSSTRIKAGGAILDLGWRAVPSVVDWNNDGKKDIIVGNEDGLVFYYPNMATDELPIFGTTPLTLKTLMSDIDIGGFAAPRVFDWNNDHNKDLVVGDMDGFVRVFLNIGSDANPVLDNGSKVMLADSSLDNGKFATPFIVDWDENCTPDILIGDIDGFVTLYRSTAMVDLYITKSVDQTQARTGSILSYTISYGNRGSNGASLVEIVDHVPAGTIYEPNSASGSDVQITYLTNGTWTTSQSTATSQIKWTRDFLEAGRIDQRLSFKVRILGTETISNRATINSRDSVSPIDSNLVITQTQPYLYPPDFSKSIKKVNPVGTVSPGQVLTYEIICGNSGVGTATNLVVTDILDPNLINVTNIFPGGVYAGGSITWQIPSLKSGYSLKLSFQAMVNSPIQNGLQIRNRATIISDQTQMFQTNEVINIVLAPSSGSDDWPMFHFNPSHSGYEPGEDLVLPMGLKWVYTTPSSSPNYSSPVVANGKVYVGSRDGNIYALDANNGSLIGTYATGAPIDSTPAVNSGYLYLANQQGGIFSLTPNPSLKWSYQSGSGISLSSPVIVDGVIYLGLTDGRLCAVDAADGHLLWAYPTNNSIASSPAIDNGLVYVGSDDKKVYCLNNSNGELKWSYQTEGKVSSSPAVQNKVVYIGSEDKRLYALDAVNGTLTWSYLTAGEIKSSPAVVDNTIYFGSLDGYFYALNTQGQLKWRANIQSPIHSSPAIADSVAYFGADDGRIYGLNLNTGKEVWRYDLSSQPIYSSPAIANGTLYIAATGKVYALSASPNFTDRLSNKMTVSPEANLKPGHPVTYTIFYQNTGNGPAYNLVITDSLDPNIDIISATGSPTISGRLLSWEIGTVAAGSAGRIVITAQVKTTATLNSQITNQAVFNWGANFSFTTNYVSNQIVTDEVLVAVKKVSPAGPTITPGSQLTYTIEFANQGNSPLTNLVITDLVDDHLMAVSPNNQGQFNDSTRVLTWHVPSLLAGSKGQVSFTAKVRDRLSNATLIKNDQATITSDQILATITTASTTLMVASPELSLSIKSGASTCIPGETLTYTISYTNTGSQTATGVRIIDTLDANLSIVQPPTVPYNPVSRTIIWQLGQMEVGKGGTLSFKAKVKSPLAMGTSVRNQAIIQSDQVESFTNEVVTTIQSAPDFSQSRKDAWPKDGIPLNKILTYTISYQNTGLMDARDVAITDTLSPELSVSTITSTSEALVGPKGLNLNLHQWTRQLGGVDGWITITTNHGKYQSLEMNSYPSLQELINDINDNPAAKVKISYDSVTDRFTLAVPDGWLLSIEEDGLNPFFSAVKLPTGYYCTGSYTNQTINWQVGEVKSGQAGSVTFRAMVINQSGTIANQAAIRWTDGTFTTNRVINTVDTTPAGTSSVKIIEGKREDEDMDANLDGNYTVFWSGWGDLDSGIAGYGLEESLDQVNWATLSTNISAATPYYPVSNRAKGKTYFYRLRAMNGAGLWSDYARPSDGIRVVDQSIVVIPGSSSKAVYPLSSPDLPARAASVSGQTEVIIPANAFASTITFTIYRVGIPQARLDTSVPLISAILQDSTCELLALKQDYYGQTLQPQVPITLTIPYLDPNPNNENEDLSYRIYWLNNGQWEIVTGEQRVDPINNLVTAYPRHLSIFGVAAPATKLGEVKAWPNPFKPRLGHQKIKVSWGGEKANIWIYNLAGELVFKQENINDHPFEWTGINNQGEELASGVYIYIIENETGERAMDKLAIVK